MAEATQAAQLGTALGIIREYVCAVMLDCGFAPTAVYDRDNTGARVLARNGFVQSHMGQRNESAASVVRSYVSQQKLSLVERAVISTRRRFLLVYIFVRFLAAVNFCTWASLQFCVVICMRIAYLRCVGYIQATLWSERVVGQYIGQSRLQTNYFCAVKNNAGFGIPCVTGKKPTLARMCLVRCLVHEGHICRRLDDVQCS